MEKRYFITAIDTDAGKTMVTGLLARRFAGERRTITMKMVQTGCTGISEDIAEHRRIMGSPLLPEDRDGTTCPYVFNFPASPLMAAGRENRTVDPDQIERCASLLVERYDLVLIEGVGGLMVPLCENRTVLDYLKKYPQPVLLVSGGQLGSVNHTLLSLEACRTHGVPVAGMIYNRFRRSDPEITEHTEDFLREYLRTRYPQAGFAVCDPWTEGDPVPGFSGLFPADAAGR